MPLVLELRSRALPGRPRPHGGAARARPRDRRPRPGALREALREPRGVRVALAGQINAYVKEWEAVGFRSPATYRNPFWLPELDVDYDSSYMDNATLEPQRGGICSAFPFMLSERMVELPITLPMDHTLINVLRRDVVSACAAKLEWVRAQHGLAMALFHPDYNTTPRCDRSLRRGDPRRCARNRRVACAPARDRRPGGSGDAASQRREAATARRASRAPPRSEARSGGPTATATTSGSPRARESVPPHRRHPTGRSPHDGSPPAAPPETASWRAVRGCSNSRPPRAAPGAPSRLRGRARRRPLGASGRRTTDRRGAPARAWAWTRIWCVRPVSK